MKKLLDKYNILVNHISRSKVEKDIEDKEVYNCIISKKIIDNNAEEVKQNKKHFGYIYSINDNVHRVYDSFEKAYEYISDFEFFNEIAEKDFKETYEGKKVFKVVENKDSTRIEFYNGFYIDKIGVK